jgi:hypothetical protein
VSLLVCGDSIISALWVAHLVGLVVVLRVVLEDLGLLLVLEGLQQVVDTATELLSPLLAVDEPVAVGLDVVNSSALEGTYICLACSTTNFLARRKRSMVKVSRRSWKPDCSSEARSWWTWASCSGVVWPG